MAEKKENDKVSLKEYMETRLDHLEEHISNVESHMATGKDIEELRGDIKEIRGEFSQMSERVTNLRNITIGAIGGPILLLVLTVVLKVFGLI